MVIPSFPHLSESELLQNDELMVLIQQKGAHAMESFPQETLEQLIVRAKQSTYVRGSRKLLPYRLGSKDLQWTEGDWAYHDSYLGESDFIGQEIV